MKFDKLMSDIARNWRKKEAIQIVNIDGAIDRSLHMKNLHIFILLHSRVNQDIYNTNCRALRPHYTNPTSGDSIFSIRFSF